MDDSGRGVRKAGRPDPTNRGLYCTAEGVFIGPACALIDANIDSAGHKSFRVRPQPELDDLLNAAYGTCHGYDFLRAGLEPIAKALDDGNLTLTHIGMLQLRLPELPDQAALERIGALDLMLKGGFNPDEPRDDHGRWTAGGNGGSAQADPPGQTQSVGSRVKEGLHHVHFKSGVSDRGLSDRARAALQKLADEYYRETGKDLTVTSAFRTHLEQAQVMYDELQNGIKTKYHDTEAYNAIKNAYDKAQGSEASEQATVAAMAQVIDQQVAQDEYISDHLKGNAVDIRIRDLSPDQIAALIQAASDAGFDPRLEGNHLHLQFPHKKIR